MRIKITAKDPFGSVHGLARSTQIGYWIRILSQENAASHSSDWGIGVISATKQDDRDWIPDRDNHTFAEFVFPQAGRIRV
jgi:hypothetical protein